MDKLDILPKIENVEFLSQTAVFVNQTKFYPMI